MHNHNLNALLNYHFATMNDPLKLFEPITDGDIDNIINSFQYQSTIDYQYQDISDISGQVATNHDNDFNNNEDCVMPKPASKSQRKRIIPNPNDYIFINDNRYLVRNNYFYLKHRDNINSSNWVCKGTK